MKKMMERFNSWKDEPRETLQTGSVQSVLANITAIDHAPHAICQGGDGCPACSGGCGSGPYEG